MTVTVEGELAVQLVARLNVLNGGGGSGLYTGIGVFTLGKNVRVGPVEPPSENQAILNSVPHLCIFLMGYGGRKPIHYKGATGGERFPTVQLWIRSRVNAYAVGKAVADACVEALDAQPSSTSVLNFYETRVLNSEPFFVQTDDAGHREWTVNVEAPRRL